MRWAKYAKIAGKFGLNSRVLSGESMSDRSCRAIRIQSLSERIGGVGTHDSTSCLRIEAHRRLWLSQSKPLVLESLASALSQLVCAATRSSL